MSAGNWKVSDLPPPVGNIASNDLPFTAAWAARSCSGSPSYVRKRSYPKNAFRL